MKRIFKGLLREVLGCLLTLLLVGVLMAGGLKLLKCADRAVGLGLWPAEPCLDSIDPFERADAARLAAKKYGGQK